MKLTFRSPDGSLVVEAEPKDMKTAFDASGQIRVYLMPGPCGCCKSKNTFPSSHQGGEFKFYEHVCGDCGATFSFGQAKEGGHLFPKKKDKDGNLLPNHGWSVYQAPSARNGQPHNHSQEPNKEPQSYADEEVPF